MFQGSSSACGEQFWWLVVAARTGGARAGARIVARERGLPALAERTRLGIVVASRSVGAAVGDLAGLSDACVSDLLVAPLRHAGSV